jgi:carboxypeptidase C (cathepsin A)
MQTDMKRVFLFILAMGIQLAIAQTKSTSPGAAAPELRTKPEEGETVKTKGSVTVNGKVINYTATTGYMPLKTEEGKLRANIFYVAYTKDDGGDLTKRPVTYTFNGRTRVGFCLVTYGGNRAKENRDVG